MGRYGSSQPCLAVDSSGLRLRVGDFRVAFEETANDITVTKVAPRGAVYD